ncbi:major facilitator superfamily domain-containing protein [Podospora australis]|uniref:Probable transporter MCH1 n=1 Tax=Podospora australis TaxID=1536484 RepID=A0AAN6WZ56_9PEZI|nr:major facilitator superfamily domain-containing protein [Podospora australis]
MTRQQRSRSPSPAPSTLGPASSSASSIRSLSSSRRLLRHRSRNISPESQQRTRNISFVAALLSALCAGSITIFSLYAPTFQTKLHYSQYRINGLASAASIAMYIPVPLLGYLCDRIGPAPLSLLAAVFFSAGYAGAAACFHFGGQSLSQAQGVYPFMAASFVAIGVGTCSMYMSAVATCAKNFGRGKHRGLALAVPIAAFGLSGMWMSQVGDHLFSWSLKESGEREVDVVRFFIFLSVLLLVVGTLGAGGLKIVDEEEIIEEAVEELERSGLLTAGGSAFLTPGRLENGGYGAIERTNPLEEDMEGAGILDPRRKDAEEEEEQEEVRLKKQWVLNAETRRFLTDHTMWCFALGFFFMIGPGEAFINNMGTVIKTLYPSPDSMGSVGEKETSAATHVSIVGITSTVVRLLTGTLTDWLAPSPQARHIQIMSASSELNTRKKFSVSRVAFLLFFAVVLSAGLAGLAAGFAQSHGDRFWIISGLVGAGYGAVFSLTPIIITVIWGVENFATNWGIVAMFPALGATMWGLVYSAVYQDAAKRQQMVGGKEEEGDNLCYGVECYAGAFWAMAVSVWVACGLVLFAWKGRGGWSARGILV